VSRATKGLVAIWRFRLGTLKGALGTVVEADSAKGGDHDLRLLVRGGTNERLFFHLPLARIHEIVPGQRTVISEVDVTDFTARLNDDGTVGLYLPNQG
jgi:hypothetical protein